MEYEKVRLVLTPSGQRSRVFVNDREIKGLVAVTVEASVEKVTTVTLSFHAEVSADGEVAEAVRDVTSMASETREFRHLRSPDITR